MSNHINPIFFPGDPLHSLPQSHLRPAPGIMLYLVTPQPACRLVYACMGDHCGMWGYPTESVWREWGDEDYKLPEKFEAEDRGAWWRPPCHVGDILPALEPWAFIKCGDCYACESPRTIYQVAGAVLSTLLPNHRITFSLPAACPRAPQDLTCLWNECK